jgi:hypothetical protein
MSKAMRSWSRPNAASDAARAILEITGRKSQPGADPAGRMKAMD